MTVSYNLDVSSVSAFSFFRLVFRWRGSIWKSVYYEFFLWITLYYTVFVIYRFTLNEEQQSSFGRVSKYCDSKLDYIPLTFMLGFFVTIVIERWRQVFNNMGWIENVALLVNGFYQGSTDDDILKRRSIIRYCVLSQILTFRDISMRVRRRFPNMESLIKAGFLHDHELKALDEIDIDYNKYWAPLNWAVTLCQKAHKDGKITTAPSLTNMVMEIKNFRQNLALLCNFDWVPIPIAYPQVVFLAVRVHFIICCVSRQYLIHEAPGENIKSIIDLYFPFMTSLQFIFLVGWMKVAEALLNPLGEDDDDFECNFLIDKNIAIGLAMVDTAYDFHPELLPDKFMDKSFQPVYSEDSTKHGQDSALFGSAQLVTLAEPTEEVKMVSVDPKVSMHDLFAADENNLSRRSTINRLRRRLSLASNSRFKFGKRGTQPKISPVELGVSLPPNFVLNGDRHNKHYIKKGSSCLSSPIELTPHVLVKVDEEESTNSKKSSGHTAHSDIESDDEIHEVIRNELNPPEVKK